LQSPPRPLAALLFAATIGVGACLLFQVQFILGKQVLPWFGGAPAVWTTCMLFFQLLLLLGYAYAHLLGQGTPSRQRAIHLTALALATVLLVARITLWPSPITPSDAWKPGPGDNPATAILGLLLFTIGPPYLVLSATGPLLQSWYARVFPGASPYRLYALSNLGSLLGLLSYPFALEPALAVAGQGWVWSAGFLLFAACCAGAAVLAGRAPPLPRATSGHVPKDSRPPGADRMTLWFTLAMLASVLLLAITSQISLEVAVIPFLWMLPLALYLLSFVLCFEYERVYHRGVWISLLLLGAGGTAAVIRVGVEAPMLVQLATYLLTLFFACMVCHGELVRRKPDPRHLTGFYLLVSAGGAAGGIFTGILAPALFPDLWELPLALVAVVALALFLARDGGRPRRPVLRALIEVIGLGYLLALAGTLAYHAHAELEDHIHVSRGFFGVLRVDTDVGESGELRTRLRHGRIIHGLQFADPDLARMPTSYYGPGSAVGLAIRNHPRRKRDEPMRMGFVGLGAGTLASYAAAADTVRFYEINPHVVALSGGGKPFFTYLRDCAGTVELAIGDARINLEREPEQKFDVLALDAFSSDSIPVHLLTLEAVELYLRHMRGPDSVIAVHISNRYLDLDPVVRGIAEALGLTVLRIDDPENNDMVYSSDWMLLARDPAALADPELKAAETEPENVSPPFPLWTDAYSNLLQVFKG
jgi:hypothetical protein